MPRTATTPATTPRQRRPKTLDALLALPRPKTLWELCLRACWAIELEPELYYQETWERERDCGTSYCRGGWMVRVAAGKVAQPWMSGELAFFLFRRRRSVHLIWDLHALFAISAVPPSLVPGSPEYSREGVSGLRKFMRKHRIWLQATPVPSRAVLLRRVARVKARLG